MKPNAAAADAASGAFAPCSGPLGSPERQTVRWMKTLKVEEKTYAGNPEIRGLELFNLKQIFQKVQDNVAAVGQTNECGTVDNSLPRTDAHD
jgi:hypothetical protein